MLTAMKYFHLLSIVIWIGSITFFSFIAAPAIFRTLERKLAGDVVGVIFPQYFLVGQACSLIALATLTFMGLKTGFSGSVKVGIALLLVMACLSAYSGLVNGPKAKEVKQLIKVETDDAKKAELKKSFGKLHGISMVVNMVILILGLVLIFFLTRYISGGVCNLVPPPVPPK